MKALGRPGRRPDCLTAATKRLVELKLLATSRDHMEAPTAYSLNVLTGRGRAERFDVVPYELLEALAEGSCSPTALRTWLHVDEALGYEGRTGDSAAEIGARIGISADAVYNHVRLLAALGMVTMAGSRRSWYLRRGSNIATSAETAEAKTPTPETTSGAGSAAAVNGGAQAAETPARGLAGTRELAQACDLRSARRGENAGSAGEEMRGLSLTPVSSLAPENPSFAPRAHRHLGDARTPATSGRTRPKARGSVPRRGSIARPDVRAVMDRLDEQWADGDARRWRNGLAAVIGKHLDQGVAAGVLVAAMNEYADLDAAGGRHIPAARAGIRVALTDVRLGLACRSCAAAEDLDRGVCAGCRRQAQDAEWDREFVAALERDPDALPPLALRVLVLSELGVTPEEVALTDPEAAAALAAAVSEQAA